MRDKMIHVVRVTAYHSGF